jgi:predicted secreted hydrolase
VTRGAIRSIIAFLGAAAVLQTTAAASIDWEVAQPGYHYVFPADYGSHERYRHEWWYYSGNLRDRSGRRFGFELTIFRYGIEHPISHPSAWDIDDLYTAHFAVTDVAGRKFSSFSRTERAALGIAGASTADEHAHVGDWNVDRRPDGSHILAAHSDGVGLRLALVPEKAPIAQGSGGIVQTGACAACTTHYYSITRLRATGTLDLDGRRYIVEGVAWHDHEWGSVVLDPRSPGWDWFAMQLDDGRDVMLNRLRRPDGSTLSQSSGTIDGADSVRTFLSSADFRVSALSTWISPRDGARYPAGWNIELPATRTRLAVRPLVDDQELVTDQGVSYWEGACTIRGTVEGKAVSGVGYTELTGYAPGSMDAVR